MENQEDDKEHQIQMKRKDPTGEITMAQKEARDHIIFTSPSQSYIFSERKRKQSI